MSGRVTLVWDRGYYQSRHFHSLRVELRFNDKVLYERNFEQPEHDECLTESTIGSLTAYEQRDRALSLGELLDVPVYECGAFEGRLTTGESILVRMPPEPKP